jgi:hypothetical protein
MIGDNCASRVERYPNQLQGFAGDDDAGAGSHLEKRDWRRNHSDRRRRGFSINRATRDGGTGVLRGYRSIGGNRCDGRV